jgi:hypothetical protein
MLIRKNYQAFICGSELTDKQQQERVITGRYHS